MVGESDFSEHVKITVWLSDGQLEQAKKHLTEISGGSIIITSTGETRKFVRELRA